MAAISTEQESNQVQALVDKFEESAAALDRAIAALDRAINDLIERSYDRLSTLASAMLRQSFPAIRQVHSTHSVLHEALIGFLTALKAVRPKTARDFFGLAAYRIRMTMLGMARDRTKALKTMSPESLEPSTSTLDPSQLALWTELHERVGELQGEQGEIFHLVYYQGLTKEEAAQLMGIAPQRVSEHWHGAVSRLRDVLEKLV